MRRTVILLFILAFSLMTANAQQVLLQDEQNTIDVFQKASPYVVFIHRYRTVFNHFFDAFDVKSGRGSGILWNAKGYVVTNWHVVRGARKLTVSVPGGKAIRAIVIGSEPRKDIAVLKMVDIRNVNFNQPLPIANSDAIVVGQKTIAIGNPYGLDRTLTTGVISAVGRKVPGIGGVTIHDMIQTDASINPGNSGGPLLNSKGELIGINTIIFSRSGSSAGIGFAVPSNTVRRIVEQLIRTGRVMQPGIGFHRIDDRIAVQLGVTGVLIGEVIPGTPAAQAGLRGTKRDRNGEIIIGDVIIGINGNKVSSYDDFYNLIEKVRVGDTIVLNVLRNNRVMKIELKTIDIAR